MWSVWMTCRAISSRTSLAMPLTNMTKTSCREYRAVGAVLGRAGSSALVEKPRAFSKKQKKRFKKKMLVRVKDIERSTSKTTNDLMSEQLDFPDTKNVIETAGDSLLKDVREMMLPDGLQELLEQLEENGEFNVGELKDNAKLNLSDVVATLKNELSGSGHALSTTDPQMNIAEYANGAIVLAASKGKKSFIDSMFEQMSRLNLPVENSTLSEIIHRFSELGEHEVVDHFFDKALSCGLTPSSSSWSAYIAAKARAEGHESALEVLERVLRLGLEISPVAYNALLQDLVDNDRNDEAFEFWMRMKEEGVEPTISSYETMLQQCIQTYQVERAFNYLDELKGCKLKPTTTIFEKLFMCCGSAPHWVNGYQDIIFDAMSLMEGAELVPTSGVYNSIIYAFGRSGDAAAAEFYFWEMRVKGIKQTAATYEYLFQALAKSQRVGASKYYVRPRYVRPVEKPLSELQRLMLKAGAVATASIISSRFSSEGKLDRGKRQYAPLVSSEDEMSSEDADEELMEKLRLETLGKPDRFALLNRKQLEQRRLRDSECGRQIELSLLTKRQSPEIGKVLHISPPEQLCNNLLDKNAQSRTLIKDDVCDSISSHAEMLEESKRILPSNHESHSSNVVNLLDGEDAGSKLHIQASDLLLHDVIPQGEIDKQWQLVLFGRCPDPNYAAPIKERRRNNIIRADSLYADLLENGIEPSCRILNDYMSVASEAMQWEKASEIITLFKVKHGIAADSTTFRHLVKMHILMSDINGCMERLKEMKSKGISADRETYGLVVATLTHRDDMLGAIQILEEAHNNGIRISNRHIKKLRARCNKLGIQHPFIYPDPMLWVKDVSKVRSKMRGTRSGNKLQVLNSMTFL